jgi:hypothetical protein
MLLLGVEYFGTLPAVASAIYPKMTVLYMPLHVLVRCYQQSQRLFSDATKSDSSYLQALLWGRLSSIEPWTPFLNYTVLENLTGMCR